MRSRYRRAFIIFLMDRVYKHPPEIALPPSLQFVVNILFPLEYLYSRQAIVKYDPITRRFTIDGMIIPYERLKEIAD